MAPFILEKPLQQTPDGYAIHLTKEEVEAMGLNPSETVQVQLSAPHTAWERIADNDAVTAQKDRTYQSLW